MTCPRACRRKYPFDLRMRDGRQYLHSVLRRCIAANVMVIPDGGGKECGLKGTSIGGETGAAVGGGAACVGVAGVVGAVVGCGGS